ncbi:mycofactocin biosynthesis peptidyl-dipeptidase MftE [Gordonia sinesedis]
MTRPEALGQRSWPELEGRSITALVPVGAVEQHGPHLPLDTDTRIATSVVAAALARRGDPDLLSAPELSYGASGEHEGFAGTVSVGHDALGRILVEYGRSACRWAHRVLFVNGHGGNAETVRSAVTQLRDEGRDVAWFPCTFADADAHAGHTETSVLLHLSPDLVRADRIVAGNRAPIAELLPALRSGGVAAAGPTGILGDPTTATAADGERLFDDLVGRLADRVGGWIVDARGLLT